MSQKKGSLLLVALIFGVVGILPLGLGAYVYTDISSFEAIAIPSEGEVTEIFLATSKARAGGSDLNSYAPKVAFTTKDGTLVEYRASASSSDPGYKVGDTVPILYDPNEPERAKINSFFHMWLFPTILLSVGSLFTALALLIVVLDFKERKALTVQG